MLKKISLITVVYNGIEFIEQTIISVLSQSYTEIEYIIIDGGSTDGTINIIKKYNSKISFWKSEPDKGIYDAMNKGLKYAKGEVVGFINSDDIYDNSETVKDVMDLYNKLDIDICYGDCVQVNRQNMSKIIRYWRSGSFRKNRYPYGWYPPHPSFFATKEIYDKFGVFDIELTIASDVDLMLRLLSSTEKKVAYLPKIISKVRLGGVSNRSIINILKLNIEIWTSLKKYQLHKSILHYVFGKASSRVSQFLKIGYKP